MPLAAHNLHAFAFLMNAFDLRGLFVRSKSDKAGAEPVPHWIDYLHPASTQD